MGINEIVRDQIKHIYKHANYKEYQGFITVEIDSSSSIRSLNDNTIILDFDPFTDLNQSYVEMFFKGRVSSKDAIIYYEVHSISIHMRFKAKAEELEKFKRAMDIFENFQNLHDQYIHFYSLITAG